MENSVEVDKNTQFYQCLEAVEMGGAVSGRTRATHGWHGTRCGNPSDWYGGAQLDPVVEYAELVAEHVAPADFCKLLHLW